MKNQDIITHHHLLICLVRWRWVLLLNSRKNKPSQLTITELFCMCRKSPEMWFSCLLWWLFWLQPLIEPPHLHSQKVSFPVEFIKNQDIITHHLRILLLLCSKSSTWFARLLWWQFFRQGGDGDSVLGSFLWVLFKFAKCPYACSLVFLVFRGVSWCPLSYSTYTYDFYPWCSRFRSKLM